MTDAIIDSAITFDGAEPDPTTTYPPLFGSSAAELAAGEAIRNYCGWHIAPSVTEVMTVDGSGRPVQTLPTLHINSVTAVAMDGTVLTSDEYEWSESGFLRRCWRRCWSGRLRGVTATINHGYATTPLEVSALITRLAQIGIQGRSGSVTVGQVQVSSTTDQAAGVLGLDAHAMRILGRYRIPNA